MTTKLEPVSADVIVFGTYSIDLNTVNLNVMVKLVQAIRDAFPTTQQVVNLEHSLQLLREFEIKEETPSQIEHLRLLLKVFVQQWWMSKPANIPADLQKVETLVRMDAQIKPTVREKPTDPKSLLVIDSNGNMEISETLGKMRAKLMECRKTNTAAQCEQDALARMP